MRPRENMFRCSYSSILSSIVLFSGQMNFVHEFSLCMAAGRERPEGGTLTVRQLLRLPCQFAILCGIFFLSHNGRMVLNKYKMDKVCDLVSNQKCCTPMIQ